MTRKAAKIGDIGTDHDGFHPTAIIEGSSDVFIDGIPAARVGDALAPHDKPKNPLHPRAIASGSSTVFINGKPAALTGSAVDCGGVIIGSGTVVIGDQAPAARSAPVPQPTRPVEIPANSGYWPPYDFAQGKHLEVIYTAVPVNFAVLSLEEGREFLSNLYQEIGGKDRVSDLKSKKDTAIGLYSAAQTAHGLGGLGVQSRIKNINGVDWIIIKNFRRHKQTLMKGNKWLASNPKVVQAMIGITSLKGAKTYVKGNPGVEVAFSIGVNAADYILRDEATLIEFGVNTAGDMAKGFTATAGASGIAVAVSVVTGGSILWAGAVFVFAAYLISKALDDIDSEYGYSKYITLEIERLLK